jgi:hypothetical protein
MATVAAWFASVADAEAAVARLRGAGVPAGDISLLTPQNLRGVTAWSHGAWAGQTLGAWADLLGGGAEGLGTWGGLVAGVLADLAAGPPRAPAEPTRRAFVAVRGDSVDELSAILAAAGGQVVRADPWGGPRV